MSSLYTYVLAHFLCPLPPHLPSPSLAGLQVLSSLSKTVPVLLSCHMFSNVISLSRFPVYFQASHRVGVGRDKGEVEGHGPEQGEGERDSV